MKTNLPIENYTAYQPNMLLDFTISFEKNVPEGDISRTVCEVVEGANILKYVNFKNRNSHGYDGCMLLKVLLLAKTLYGYASTRDLVDYCKNDIRFMFITHGEVPSHQTFQRFIHDDLRMPLDDIFFEMNRYMEEKDKINTDILYIDGTKYEANANKMTFVWKKATMKFRTSCWKKLMKEITTLNHYCEEQSINMRFSILREMSIDYLMQVCETLEEYMNMNQIEFKHGKGKRKDPLQRHYDFLKESAMKMWKYEMHLDICGKRNSFSKTDSDATFMHMKYDYYNHTNVFKPGYNVQMGVSDGYIRHVYISNDANDINTYIPFMESYHAKYGCYPSKTPADAGYGSYDNYSYCKMKGIELYLKYSGQRKEAEKVTDKNRFKSWTFQKNEQGEILCPAGHVFKTISMRVDTRKVYPRLIEQLMVEHCESCPLKSKCTKSEKGRTLSRTKKLESYHEEVKANMESEEGKALMTQRSIQSEGCFAQLKGNWEYSRLRRKGETGVKTEILLVAIGHNLRKYHTRQQEKKEKEKTEEKKYH